jgi:hypothetical protein
MRCFNERVIDSLRKKLAVFRCDRSNIANILHFYQHAERFGFKLYNQIEMPENLSVVVTIV